MKSVFRLLAMLVVLIATYYFVFWVPLSFIPFFDESFLFRNVISLLCAVGIGWYTWKSLKDISEALVSSILLGAIIVGAIGFCAGFFGPMIFTPDANQGPLLGIFITGPLGFVIGGVGGFFYWLMKGRKMPLNKDVKQRH